MKQQNFERNKVNRLIRVNGVEYTFCRDVFNDFKEPTGEVEKVTVKGVFHQTTQNVTVLNTDGASVQSKQVPAIFALYDAAKDIKQGDYTVIDGIRYNVTGTVDYQHWNIAIDISMEAVV